MTGRVHVVLPGVPYMYKPQGGAEPAWHPQNNRNVSTVQNTPSRLYSTIL